MGKYFIDVTEMNADQTMKVVSLIAVPFDRPVEETYAISDEESDVLFYLWSAGIIPLLENPELN